MKGNFPANCETCNCKDKYYVDVIITTTTVPYHASEGTEEEPVEVAMAKRYREENPNYIYDLYGNAERKENKL